MCNRIGNSIQVSKNPYSIATKEQKKTDICVYVQVSVDSYYKKNDRCIKKNGLEKSRVLPQSGNHDSVLCSHVMDVDWDGENEILIGTYGRQVLIYKQGKWNKTRKEIDD